MKEPPPPPRPPPPRPPRYPSCRLRSPSPPGSREGGGVGVGGEGRLTLISTGTTHGSPFKSLSSSVHCNTLLKAVSLSTDHCGICLRITRC